MSSLDSLYVMIFMTGLLGGFGHCLGMCGPVVATYSLNLRGQNLLAHVLYHLGRITTYGIMGGIIGLTGSFVGVVKSIERFQAVTLAFVGCAMIVMGLRIAGLLRFPKVDRQGIGSRLLSFVLRNTRRVSEAGGIGTYFPLGLILGFIPCGLLYTALIAAAGAGAEAGSQVKGFLNGMAMLLLFGLGTAPSLFLLGHLVSMGTDRIRSRLYKASGVLSIVMGVIFVSRSVK